MYLKEAMATNLRRERHARDMTQEELADQAGLSSRYLGSIERGAVSASVTVLGRLAKALRVNPCELILSRSPENRRALGQRFHSSNHIRQPRRVCKTMCGQRGGD
jgi:transcriptional regulator with XRE-family HTH domain